MIESSLKSLKTTKDDNLYCSVKRIIPEKKQMVIALNKSIESTELSLTTWTTKGTFKLDLTIIETLKNKIDHVVEVRDTHQLDNECFSLSAGEEFLGYDDPDITTSTMPDGVHIKHPITGYSRNFITINAGETKLNSVIAKSINKSSKVIIYSKEERVELSLKANNKCEIIGSYLKINLQTSSEDVLHQKLTPLDRSKASKLL